MDHFAINQQIEELGYVIISDLSEAELTELLESMKEEKPES